MNSLQKQNNGQGQVTFSKFITSEGMKKRIYEMVGSDKGQGFITAIISATTSNPALQRCEPSTIVSAALLGESLKLSPSPIMGQYYLVPFNNKGGTVAQFQIGYKGYIQLAMRTGQYRELEVIEIKEGEHCGRDNETGKIKFSFIQDEDERNSKETIGYLAYFELLNGFRKLVYWTKNEVEKHAMRYSQAFRSDKNNGTSYSFWSKSFNEMAFKTLLRHLISRWGIMSVDMEKAFTNDMAVVKEDGKVEYIDNLENDLMGTPVPEVVEEPKQQQAFVEQKSKALKKVAEVKKEETPSESDLNALFGEGNY